MKSITDRYNRMGWFIHVPSKTNILFERVLLDNGIEKSHIPATGESFVGTFDEAWPALISALRSKMREIIGEEIAGKTAITTAFCGETRPIVVEQTWIPPFAKQWPPKTT